MSNKNLTYGLIVVGIIAIVGVFTPVGQKVAGLLGVSVDCQQTTCLENGLRITSGQLETDGTLQVGSTGTAQTKQVSATCNPIADISVAATSTAYIYCTGVTGVVFGDVLFAQFSTSTNAIGAQWSILGSRASSTAGVVDIKIMNLTGTAAVPSASAGAQFASSTKIFVSDF